MKYKFTPNARVTFLNQNERAALVTILMYRNTALVDAQSLGDELGLIDGLVKKLRGT